MTMYHEAQRDLQDAFDSRRLADRLEQVTVHQVLDDGDLAFLAAADFFFLATVDPTGQPTCSFKAGPPGFVRVVDPTTVAFPVYDGNGMWMSMGNTVANPQVGLLFIDFEHPNRLRLHGTATVALDDPLLAEFPEAQLIVRVAITALFPNCPRYIPRFERVATSAYVPQPGCETPVAPWKRLGFFQDVLPAVDQPKVAALPPLSIEEYIAGS